MDGIELTGVTRRFGTRTAADDLGLTVAAGEIVALLGPNGAGKSTVTRICAGLVRPDTGTATVAGAPAGERRDAVGLLLSEDRAWYWRLSGRANLEFFAILHGLPRPRARERADEVLGAVDLDDAGDRRVGEYSSGMRARLALARALVPRPEVLLLDEPTRSLDPLAAIAFRDLVRAEAARGAAILLTTHDLHEAADVADRVLVLHRGRIVARAGSGATARDLEDLLRRNAVEVPA